MKTWTCVACGKTFAYPEVSILCSPKCGDRFLPHLSTQIEVWWELNDRRPYA